NRRRVLVGILLLATLCGVLFLRPRDPVGAALGRIHPGMAEADLEAAIGRAADGSLGEMGSAGELDGRTLYWQYDDDFLFVGVDEDGRAVEGTVGYWVRPTLWSRLWAWWPW